MVKTLIALAVVTLVPTPKPPELCEPIPVMDSYLCPNSDVNYVFTVKVGCDKPVLAFHNCAVVDTEDPANFAPPPDVDPEFDEHGPGPGEGPPGAGTVDKPDLPGAGTVDKPDLPGAGTVDKPDLPGAGTVDKPDVPEPEPESAP